jgi:hypothetical protein
MTAAPDSVRDALALVLCSLRDDQEDSGVIKANAADPGEVAGVLADVVAELFRVHARVLADGDPLTLLDRVRAGLTGDGGA